MAPSSCVTPRRSRPHPGPRGGRSHRQGRRRAHRPTGRVGRASPPPRLFDLPSLQKTCGQRWGWTADKTLAIAQELYDGEAKKVITYPRAEARRPTSARQQDEADIAALGFLAVVPDADTRLHRGIV